MRVSLRLAKDSDLELIMAWRSHPLVYQGFYSQKAPLTWAEHYTWWKSRHNWKQFIIQVTEGDDFTRAVGCVALGQLDSWAPQIGFYVGEISLWGKGVVKQAIRLALDWLREKGYCMVWTTVKEDNFASIKVLEGLGFEHKGKGRPGEQRYER